MKNHNYEDLAEHELMNPLMDIFGQKMSKKIKNKNDH